MNFISFKKNKVAEKKLPDSVYKSVVVSLYADPNSLAIGIFCCIVGALVLFWKTLDPAQLIFAALFLSFGTMRLLLARSFQNAVKHNMAIVTYKIWEDKYNLISTLYIAILGFWYANGLIRSNDPYVQLLSLSLILCYMTGIIGRNFASNRVVRSQVIVATLCLMTSTALFDNYNGMYGSILALFLGPFFVATYHMSSRLRGMLFKAEINALNNQTIANRFDVALDNVMHGIAMIDKKGCVIVANVRFMELAGMSDWEINGCQISILNTVEIVGNKYSTLGDCIENCLQQDSPKKFSFTLVSDDIIEMEYNSTADGGVVVLSDISERKASEKAIKDLADLDPLTNLSNRRHFIESVEQFILDDQHNTPCSMYFIDLDKFKEVNDTLGHAIGDDLLCVVASRLKTLFSGNEIICRWGGDEFVIFSSEVSGHEECCQFASDVLRELRKPLSLGSHKIEIGGSIGIALMPDHGVDANTLLQNADSALYESKAKGRSTFTFYTDDLGESIRQKRNLQTDLRLAIKENAIDVHFQPLLDVKNSTIASCEALARWTHPTLGTISPGIFIELAEEIGLINDLGEVVLRKSMLECLKWPEGVRVAVNVSSIQFQKSDVYKLIKGLLSETGLAANRLTVEVTESAMIESFDDISNTLHQLSALGVHISLDDFGTGFSNLSYLYGLHLDKVKIDKSFVDNGIADAKSLVLLQGVVDLLKRLGLKVVLEGIETRDQLKILERCVQVHEYQGYLFFKPMPAENVLEILNRAHIVKENDVQRLAWQR